jgi:hypothetical protein
MKSVTIDELSKLIEERDNLIRLDNLGQQDTGSIRKRLQEVETLILMKKAQSNPISPEWMKR